MKKGGSSGIGAPPVRGGVESLASIHDASVCTAAKDPDLSVHVCVSMVTPARLQHWRSFHTGSSGRTKDSDETVASEVGLVYRGRTALYKFEPLTHPSLKINERQVARVACFVGFA